MDLNKLTDKEVAELMANLKMFLCERGLLRPGYAVHLDVIQKSVNRMVASGDRVLVGAAIKEI